MKQEIEAAIDDRRPSRLHYNIRGTWPYSESLATADDAQSRLQRLEVRLGNATEQSRTVRFSFSRDSTSPQRKPSNCK